MPLINYEINVFLTWPEKCITVTRNYSNQEPKFAITDTKLYVSVATLSAQDYENILQQIKSGSKKQLTGININQSLQHRHKTDI